MVLWRDWSWGFCRPPVVRLPQDSSRCGQHIRPSSRVIVLSNIPWLSWGTSRKFSRNMSKWNLSFYSGSRAGTGSSGGLGTLFKRLCPSFTHMFHWGSDTPFSKHNENCFNKPLKLLVSENGFKNEPKRSRKNCKNLELFFYVWFILTPATRCCCVKAQSSRCIRTTVITVELQSFTEPLIERFFISSWKLWLGLFGQMWMIFLCCLCRVFDWNVFMNGSRTALSLVKYWFYRDALLL